MIVLINKSNLKVHLEVLTPALERALHKTSLSNHWNMDALVDSVIAGHTHCFLDLESGLAGVLSVNSTPLGSCLSFFWAGKHPANEVPTDWAKVDEFLVQVAQCFRCTEIVCEGRKGWKPLITPLGYTEDSVVYTKEVPYEFPPI